MNREQVIQLLSQLLQDNMGNRITPALATGLATLVNQEMLKHEAQPA